MPPLPVLGKTEMAALLWYLFEPLGPSVIEDAPASDSPTGEVFPRYMMAGYQKLVDAEGFPAIQPPWGTLTAIDLARGEIAWQAPLGAYPELAARGLTNTGAESYGGPVVTAAGLVFIAGTPDAKLRAFDKATGELRFEAPLPAAGFATPAIYEADGRQLWSRRAAASSGARAAIAMSRSRCPQGIRGRRAALPQPRRGAVQCGCSAGRAPKLRC